ncbi:LLM class flavin-dependent oxidoreductase [Pseudonocardia lacus]|uniref:LLM class flavin-dependent oxidoreductase n=1 Tax=Pseudonocardia lacus TaxID=2835865 RepID=UPI001BDC35DC|nr:LLM class flavin-dependent oxidoreductase [Pseudonocardia lacus]
MTGIPRLTIAFNLRAPSWGPPAPELYDAAVEMAAWADRTGFDEVFLSEHHVTDDGYLPSPIVMAAGIATRTERVRLRLSVVLATLMHPVHLAEDLAVLDLLARGRLDVALGAGYRKIEFQTFGVDWRKRPSMMVECVQTLRAAWTGEPFDFRGVRTRVLPRPFQPGGPPLSLAGTSAGAARRAARLGLGFEPLGNLFQDVYLAELRSLGKQPPVPAAPAAVSHPAFVHIARDPDAAWAAIGKHVLHNVNEYAAYATAKELTPFKAVTDPDQLLESGAAKVVTPEECRALLRAIGPGGRFRLNPLEGGIPPELGWESLRLFETEVLAELRAAAPATGRS